MPIPRAYRNDPNAPWNDPPNPECDECGEIIVEIADHKDWCEFQESPENLHRRQAEQAKHVEYDPLEHK